MPRAVMHNKRTPVLDLEVEDCKVTKIYDCMNVPYLPLNLQREATPETLTAWLEKRRIPNGREGLRQARKNFPGFETYRNMFSLTDQYWFKYDPDENWDRLNFFTNRYSDDIGRMFFCPWDVELDTVFRESPDLMTNGALRKRWKQGKDKKSFLIKAGSKQLNQEPISEVLATMLLRKLDVIPFVEYELVVEGMRLCSKCMNFVDENTEFVPAIHLFQTQPRRRNESVYFHLLKMCDLYGIEGAKEFIDCMIAIDRILGNEDRHLGNFGFIRDVKTLKILGFAPLFDCGYAFADNTGEPRTPLFEGQGEAALMSILPRIDMHSFMDHRDMFELIKVYPEINNQQREVIQGKILHAEEEISRLKRTRTRAVSEKNRLCVSR